MREAARTHSAHRNQSQADPVKSDPRLIDRNPIHRPRLGGLATRSRLSHGRHHKVGACPDPGGPTARDRLQSGVKADAFRSVHVVIAEQPGLPASEREESHRHGNWYINSYHAYLDAV